MIKRSRMLKKSLAVLTALTLGLTLTDFNPLVQETKRILAADTLVDSGDCSGDDPADNVQWQLYDTDGDSKGDKLIISGTGKMKDYEYIYSAPWYNAPWATSKDTIKTVIVDKDVTTIGNFAFRDCINLASTFLPSGLTSIGSRAFYGCTNLALTSLPSRITSIGISAFWGCENLALTSLPSGITSIGSMAFSRCTNLALTSLPSGLTSIEDETFARCTNLALTELPSGITSIGSQAFSRCTNLALTSLPSRITSIGSRAFDGCTNLALTSLPSGITSIGDYTFYCCTNLTSLSLPSGITSIGSRAFCICTKLKTLTIPDSVTHIGSCAIDCPTVKMKYNPLATYDERCICSETILLDCDDGADLKNLTSAVSEPYHPKVYPQTVILPSNVDSSTLRTGSNFAGFYNLSPNSDYLPEVNGPIALHESWGIEIGDLILKEGCHYNGDLSVRYLSKPSPGAVTVDANIHSQPHGEFTTGDYITFNGDVDIDSNSLLYFVGDNITVNGTMNNSAIVDFTSKTGNVNINTFNNNSSGRVLMDEKRKDSVNINSFNNNGGSTISIPTEVKNKRAYTTGSAVTLENGNLVLETPWRDFQAYGETFKCNPSDWTVTYRNNTSEYTEELGGNSGEPRVYYELNDTPISWRENFNIYNVEFSSTKERDQSLLKSPATCTKGAIYYYRCTTSGYEDYTDDAHTWEDTTSILGHDWSEKVVDATHKKSEFEYWHDCGRTGCNEISDTEYWDIRPDLTFSVTQEKTASLLKSPATCTKGAIYYYRCTTWIYVNTLDTKS